MDFSFSVHNYTWTQHSRIKMSYYGLSESRVKRVLRNPSRKEEGIAPKTFACMQPASTKTKDGKKMWSQELWVMAQQTKKGDTKIISAWRYPGMSKIRAPLPAEVQMEIEEGLHNNF